MRKWLIGIVIVAILGFVGYKVGMNYVSNKVMDKIQGQIVSPQDVEEMKKDPEIQQIIKDNFSEEEVKRLLPDLDTAAPPSPGESSPPKAEQPASGQSSPSAPASSASGGGNSEDGSAAQKPLTRKQAEDLVMSKFSLGELKSMSDMAKDGLSSEEKTQIKNKLKGKLTDEQYEQLKVTALIEIMKQQSAN
jgi:hypothetical protein